MPNRNHSRIEIVCSRFSAHPGIAPLLGEKIRLIAADRPPPVGCECRVVWYWFRMSGWSRFCCASSLALSVAWASVARAEPSAADRATARALAGKGFQALQAKDYAAAADHFGRADALVHAPTLTVDWARALVGLGQFVEAQERYELIVREGVDAKAPKSWQRALSDATKELSELKPRLAWVTVAVAGAREAHVTIDGVPVPRAAIGVPRAVNPGARNVRVTAQGYVAQQRSLSLTEGEQTSVSFELEPEPAQEVIASPAPVAPAPEAPPARSHTSSYVAFGIAGAGLAVGGVTGILALGKRSTLKQHCPEPTQCPEADTDNVNAYHALGYASGAGFAVGVAGAATGIALWLLGDKPTSSSQGLAVRPYLGLNGIGATGRF